MSAKDSHANLSDQQLGRFVQVVRNTGGATMDARSGRMVPPGKRGYIVGGEHTTKKQGGARVPTSYVPEAEFNEEHVRRMASQITHQTGGRARVNVGAWVDNGQVELDASARVKRPGEALRKGRNRGEKEIWDNRRMRGIQVKPSDS